MKLLAKKKGITHGIMFCMQTIQVISEKIVPILEQHHIERAALFGSVVRGDMTESSDIDILVDVPDNVHGLDYIGYRLDLQKNLEYAVGRPVDLVEFRLVKPSLKPYIERTMYPLTLN